MNGKKGKLMFVLLLVLVLAAFGLLVYQSAQAAPVDDDPIPPVLVWWRGCRTNDFRSTNGLVSCYKMDGVTIAWQKMCEPQWVRGRGFAYSGGTMTGVACLAPGIP